ncbi:MAG: hypothetical protein OXG39_07845 [Chloroflexi bacterium]|nr:hypothetical protein [Chloroflexota bacterium]
MTIEALIRTLIALLYIPISLFVYWRLVPRLLLSGRLLVSVLLAAQVLVIALPQGIQPTSQFERWFWDLNQEGNIAAALASAQLALVSIVALLSAWLIRTWPTWRRLYMAGLGLVFLFFAWDEFFLVHERIRNWEIFYIALGAVVVAATLLVATRSPAQSRKWHICLLTGLAISAAGAIALEYLRIPAICDQLGFLPEAGRCQLFIVEESLEFLGIWLTLVAALGLFSSARPRPRPLVRVLLFVLPLLWIVVLSPATLVTFLDFRLLHQPISIEYEPGVELQAYRVDRDEDSFALDLFASTVDWQDYNDLGYSLHLVDQASGESLAGTDASASRQQRWRIAGRSYYFWIYKQRLSLQLPPRLPSNRALQMVLSLWRREGDAFLRQRITSSDLPLLNDTQVILGQFVLPAESAVSSSLPAAKFENGFTLGAVDLPERAQAGEALAISFAWRADKDGLEDTVQFLHFGYVSPPGEGGSVEEGAESVESGAWWAYDQQPLGARLPTRLWYSGLADTETWEIPLPAELAPGRYTVYTGLYRASDQVRLPANDTEGTPYVDARVPLGVLIVEGA